MRRAFGVCFALALWGCATTKVDATWIKPGAPEPVRKVLVVGLSAQTTWSRSFESGRRRG